MQLLSRRRELRWVDVLSCYRYDIMPIEFSLSRRPFLQLVRYNALFYFAFRFFSLSLFSRIPPSWKNICIRMLFFLIMLDTSFLRLVNIKSAKKWWLCGLVSHTVLNDLGNAALPFSLSLIDLLTDKPFYIARALHHPLACLRRGPKYRLVNVLDQHSMYFAETVEGNEQI